MGRNSPYVLSRNRKLTRAEIYSNINDYVYELIYQNDSCINFNNKRNTTYRCKNTFEDPHTFGCLIRKLDMYCAADSKGRQLFLHGVLTHGNLRKEDQRRGEKRSPIYALTGVEDTEGNTIHVCQNTLRNLFAIGLKQWKQISKDAMLPSPKDIRNYENNSNRDAGCTRRLVDFLVRISREESETHATRFIRMETGVAVRDSDYETVHLPSFFTKRKLYERFCYISGWVTKAYSDGLYLP